MINEQSRQYSLMDVERGIVSRREFARHITSSGYEDQYDSGFGRVAGPLAALILVGGMAAATLVLSRGESNNQQTPEKPSVSELYKK